MNSGMLQAEARSKVDSTVWWRSDRFSEVLYVDIKIKLGKIFPEDMWDLKIYGIEEDKVTNGN